MNITKTTKTYSIDKNTYESFDRLCRRTGMNKSQFIEKSIRDYLNDTIGLSRITPGKTVLTWGYDDDSLYRLKSDHNVVVSIIDGDDIFFNLSNGERISRILLYHNYEKMPKINPNEFFGSGLKTIVNIVKETKEEKDSIVDKIRNIVNEKNIDSSETLENICNMLKGPKNTEELV